MERRIEINVDLEYPEEAKYAIDKAAEEYQKDKLKWAAQEIDKAKRLAMHIMNQLCLDGYSIEWFGAEGYISVRIREYGSPISKNSDCDFDSPDWDIWIGKCVCLCRATGREVPEFITKKAGECW